MQLSVHLRTIYLAFFKIFFAKSVLKYTYILKKFWKREEMWEIFLKGYT